MLNREFILPGIASITLAVLFPIYWLSILDHSLSGFETAYREDLLSLSWFDALFVFIGLLEVYIYFSLRKILRGQLNASGVNVLLLIMIGLVALFHSLVLIDVYFALQGSNAKESSKEFLVNASQFIGIGVLILYSIMGLIFSAYLLFRGITQSVLLKVFALLLLVGSLMQISLVLAVVNILLFPIALVVLAIYFLKDPKAVDIV